MLRQALRRAVKLGLAQTNVTDDVDAPRPEKRQATVLTLEQTQTLFASTQDDPRHVLYVTLITTGLRIGEALGLSWGDVDLGSAVPTVRITRSLQRQTGKGLVFIQPKTDAGRRTIVLTQLAVEALRRHRTRQIEHRLQLADLWEDHELVFCTDFGKPLDPMNTYHAFHKALKNAGLPTIRQHDMRHTAATLMLAEGVHVKVVSEMLGHSNINLTQSTYQHVLPTMQREAADRLDAAFKRAKSA